MTSMTDLAAIERAMITIRRSQSRRALSRLAPEGDQTVFGVLDALEELGRPATVGEVGAALGVDQPRASRLVARAVEQGLVIRQADQRDGRRTLLVLTGPGRSQLAEAHRSRQEMFSRAMSDWPEADRETFARLLTSFTTSLGALTRPPAK
jgi:DNA-binding MarR family transcriptional regulator